MTQQPTRLPDVRTLYDIVPKGTEGAKEFSRIVDLLLFYDARRAGRHITLFSDAAGDFHGLDSLSGGSYRRQGSFGYQYKFYPSPLSDDHRRGIEEALIEAAKAQSKRKIKKWILVTPQDFIESATRKSGGDVTWFENLKRKRGIPFEIEH